MTQVDSPDAAMLPLTPGTRFPLGFHELSVRPVGSTSVSRGAVEMLRDVKTPYKLGSASPEGYAAMRKNGARMIVEADYNAHARYPDNDCAQEIYSNPNPLRYMELELLGPLRMMPPRAENELVTRWRLERAR